MGIGGLRWTGIIAVSEAAWFITCREKQQQQKPQVQVVAPCPHGPTTDRGWASLQERCRTTGPASRDSVDSTWKSEWGFPSSLFVPALNIIPGPCICGFSFALPRLSGFIFCPFPYDQCPPFTSLSVSVCFLPL